MDAGVDVVEQNYTLSWDFIGSVFFTTTILTTIGYGHISPQTDAGKLFTILYAMVGEGITGVSFKIVTVQIGMPLFVMFLGGVGDTMANGFKFAYSRICCR